MSTGISEAAEAVPSAEDLGISDEAWRLWRRTQSPEVQAFVKTAPRMTADQAARLRRLWNQPGRSA